MALIRSGSHEPGIDPASFGLPAGTALRYERPAEELRGLLSSYAVLDSDLAVWDGPDSWLPPSWAQIWIILTQGKITVKIKSRFYDPLASAVLYGVTSRAMPVTAQGGVTVAIDVSPLGWARMIKHSAEDLRDRITLLHEILPSEQVRDLVTSLDGSDRDLAVKKIVDDSFVKYLPDPNPVEPSVAEIMAMLADETTGDLATATRRLGMKPATLLRVTRRYFGFTPKMLIMRARFMRAIATMLTASEPSDFSYVPPGYHNVPHFIRDANLFLGMTPRRFLAMDMPYMRAALRTRKLVLGVATPALDPAPAIGSAFSSPRDRSQAGTNPPAPN